MNERLSGSSPAAVGLAAIDRRSIFVGRPDIGDLIDEILALPPIEVVRPDDLVHLTVSFVNLRLQSSVDGGPPTLVRRTRSRPAFLIVDLHAQHITEAALFETAIGYPVTGPPAPLDLRPPTDVLDDPDSGLFSALTGLLSVPPAPPVFASIAGNSRLVLKVATEAIPYTVEGLLEAISYLDLNVPPQAVPARPSPVTSFADFYLEQDLDVMRALASGGRRAGARRIGPILRPRTAQLIALSRMRATAASLDHRFGRGAAVRTAAASRLGGDLGIDRAAIDPGLRIPITTPPPPTRPEDIETAIELPWRLIVSPNEHGAFAHAATAVEHAGRVELWHTRLGVRAMKDGVPILDEHGHPTVDEGDPQDRTIRAVWARDFDVLPALTGQPDLGFHSPPDGKNFPDADGSGDRPRERMALNSRDRMMLVHETSNFWLERTVHRRSEDWVPEAVATNRLMLSGLGGWLDSRVLFDTLPDGPLTIEEWKHRAAMGRDHEVKVVYAGFLMPFGHKASLVKVTERKFAQGDGGTAAYLFQRMFLIVREPEKRFRDSAEELGDGRRLDLLMPFVTVRILTEVTPPLDPPQELKEKTAAGFLFEPRVAGAPFLFKIHAVDLEHNEVEFSAPLVFMERDHNTETDIDGAVKAYNQDPIVDRTFGLDGQRVAYAASADPDDTVIATASMTFQVETTDGLQQRPQDEPSFLPVIGELGAVIPAMSALTGHATVIRLSYPDQYAKTEFASNKAEIFLQTIGSAPMSFAGQGNRSGGFVTPNLNITGLSRVTGPVGGDIDKAMTDPGGYSVGDFFKGANARLFGLIPLEDLFGGIGYSAQNVPTFVAQALATAAVLLQNITRLHDAAVGYADQLGAGADALRAALQLALDDWAELTNHPENPPGGLGADLAAIVPHLAAFRSELESSALLVSERQKLIAIVQRVEDQLAGGATDARDAAIAFAQGLRLPEVVSARLDWSSDLKPWPAKGDDAIFKPLGPGDVGKIALAVEIQAPTKPGQDPSVLVSCSISPFDLVLIAPARFLTLHFQTVEFSMVPGKKPDVNVALRQQDGIEFDGPLRFVNTLRSLIPFDGFSDPPSLQVTAEGIRSGFDLGLPDLAVGVFALTNISLGARLDVPFVDESIETAFNFSTRENPFRLQVALFAGGGFFGVTITPKELRVVEAALEFGAAISVNLGVASGGVSVMAGVYFRLEQDQGKSSVELTGYFRMRGEVDVLGLVSACIEVYLAFTYETATNSAVGRATITIEVEVCFFSFSVSVSCEKKFAGSSAHLRFTDLMGLAPGAPAGSVRPWNTYCHAFAND